MIGGEPMSTKSEADWEAESDARTIIEADVIKADPQRFSKAQARAKIMLEEAEAKAKALKKLANANMSYPKSPKPSKKY